MEKRVESSGKGTNAAKQSELDKSLVDRGFGKADPKKSGCFICGEPHRARKCPKKEQMTALLCEEDEDAPESCVRLGTLQVVGGGAPTRTSDSPGGGGL